MCRWGGGVAGGGGVQAGGGVLDHESRGNTIQFHDENINTKKNACTQHYDMNKC